MVTMLNASDPIELEIKDTTDTAKSGSYFHVPLEIDNGGQFTLMMPHIPL